MDTGPHREIVLLLEWREAGTLASLSSQKWTTTRHPSLWIRLCFLFPYKGHLSFTYSMLNMLIIPHHIAVRLPS